MQLMQANMPPKKRRGGRQQAEISRMEDELNSLSPIQLRKEVQDAGMVAGPIDPSNK